MKNRKNCVSKFRFALLTAICAISVTSAAVFSQAVFRADDGQTTDAVFSEQHVGETVDLTDAIAEMEKQEEAEEKKAVEEPPVLAEEEIVEKKEIEKETKKINDNIAFEKGVKDLSVSLDKKTVTISYDPSKTDEAKLKAALEKLGYTVTPAK